MEYTDRFSDNLQQVITVAEEAAKVYGSSYIGRDFPAICKKFWLFPARLHPRSK